jgi:uncharacterized membrane protein
MCKQLMALEEVLSMKRRSIDLVVVSVLALIGAAMPFVATPGAPISMLTLPIVLVLPGYALTSAIFAKRELEVPERLVFSLGLSLIVVIVGGLVLNLTASGLQPTSWAVLLCGITLGSCGIAMVRLRRQQGKGRHTLGSLGAGSRGFTFQQVVLLGLAVMILCGAVVISLNGAAQQPFRSFTQFWMVPAGALSPKEAVRQGKDVVRIGMLDMEPTDMSYRIDVRVNGKEVQTWQSIRLNPGDVWERLLVLPQTGHSDTAKVEALLYRLDAPKKAYRYVELWLRTLRT